MGLVGLFAVFHRHAHGTEMPFDMSGFDYAASFIIASALLHATGIVIGLHICSRRVGRGTAMAITGVGYSHRTRLTNLRPRVAGISAFPLYATEPRRQITAY